MSEHDTATQLSMYERLLREAVPQFVLDFGEYDPRSSGELVVDYPSADSVAALDFLSRPVEILDALVGEEIADEILDFVEDKPGHVLFDIISDIRIHYACEVFPMYGFSKVVEELDIYGEAIERDLITLRLNLYDWFRDHLNTPWDKLFRILERPVEGGFYNAARLEDVEAAAEMLKAEAEGRLSISKRPSLIGWTYDRDIGVKMLETLRRIEHATYAASLKTKGKGGKAPQPLLTPATALDAVKRYNLYVEHDDIASQMLGDRYKKLPLPPLAEMLARIDNSDSDGDPDDE